MNRIKSGLVGVALVLLPFAGNGVEYNPAIDLGDLGSMMDNVRALGVNNTGQVVGYAYGDRWETRAFLWTAIDGMSDLGTLENRYNSLALDINESGQLVGYSHDSGGTNAKAFIHQNGVMKPLGSMTRALAINNSGQVVGRASLADGDYCPALFQDGMVMSLTEEMGEAQGINDCGEIVGWKGSSSSPNPFLWRAGVFTDIPTLGGETGIACDINDGGEVVGEATLNTNLGHAFLYEKGQTKDLTPGDTRGTRAVAVNQFGWVVGYAYGWAFLWHPQAGLVDLSPILEQGGWTFGGTCPTDINDKGWIVGLGDKGGRTRSFLLTPKGSELFLLEVRPGIVHVVWQVESNRYYRIELCDQLGEWLNGGISSPGRVLLKRSDSAPPELRSRYYRLEILPW